jgi:hypothetical protein
MKRKYLLNISILFLLISQTIANPIDLNRAIQVANNKINKETSNVSNSRILSQTFIIKGKNGDNVFYIINFKDGGYAIVSASDAVRPILAYGLTGNLDTTNLPSPMKTLLETYRDQIQYVVKNDIHSTKEIKVLWTDALTIISSASKKRGTSVQITCLLTTQWGQGHYWNAYCPTDINGDGGNSVAGCVAVAMAQVMAYYKYPKSGSGSKYYTSHSRGFSCGADFAGTEYSYPFTSDNYFALRGTPYSAKLLYHAGVSVEMDYNGTASGPYIPNLTLTSVNDKIMTAFKDNFLYDQGINAIYKKDFDETKWNLMLRTEIMAGRPIIYTGMGIASNGIGSAHTFILDGVRNNNEFHVNWGEASNNGSDFWWYLSELVSIPLGGTTSYNFSTNQSAIVGITPNCVNSLDITRSGDLVILAKELYPHGYTTFGNLKSDEHITNVTDEVYFQSTTRIILKPGFKVVKGATFRADTRGCKFKEKDGSGAPTNPNPNEVIPSPTVWVYTPYWAKLYPEIVPKGSDQYCSYYPNECQGGQLFVPGINVTTLENENSQTSIQDVKTDKVTIYPNPTKGFITITGLGDNTFITILNSNGLEVYSKANINKSVNIDLLGYSTGVYFIKCNSNNINSSHKLILE